MEAREIKAREHASWRRSAPGWRKHDERLRTLTGPVTTRLLDLARVTQGSRVLDLACGTGEPAIPAAERVRPSGFVLGIDFVEEMLEVARDKASARGLTNLKLHRGDGEELEAEPESFDCCTIRWGLMFMPDPAACLRRAHRALRPGGRIALACFAAPERNPWITIPIGVLRRHAEVALPAPGSPGPFAFADGERLRSALRAAGFHAVAIEELELTMVRCENGEEYVRYLFEMAGPITTLLDALTPKQRATAAREIAEEAERASQGSGVELPGVTWIASGTK